MLVPRPSPEQLVGEVVVGAVAAGAVVGVPVGGGGRMSVWRRRRGQEGLSLVAVVSCCQYAVVAVTVTVSGRCQPTADVALAQGPVEGGLLVTGQHWGPTRLYWGPTSGLYWDLTVPIPSGARHAEHHPVGEGEYYEWGSSDGGMGIVGLMGES